MPEQQNEIPEFVNHFFGFVERIEGLESVSATDEAKILGDRDNPQAGRVMIDLDAPSIPAAVWDALDEYDGKIADANAFGSVLSVTARVPADARANDTDSSPEGDQPDEPAEPAEPESDPNSTQLKGSPKLQPVPKLAPFERINVRSVYLSGNSPVMTLDKELLGASGLSLGDEVSQYATDGRVLLLRGDKDPYEDDGNGDTENETNSEAEETQS
jgi:antitoxin component of MazEF toxin-antitoxin module